MAEEIYRQANFTAGELDPSCLGRRDLKPYAAALAVAENMLPIPQGPIRRRPGLAHCALIRNRLEVVTTEGATADTPNGGDAGGIFAGTPLATATPLGTTDGYVVCEVDFGEPTAVGLVDLVDYAFVDGGGVPEPPGPNWPWWPFRPGELTP